MWEKGEGGSILMKIIAIMVEVTVVIGKYD